MWRQHARGRLLVWSILRTNHLDEHLDVRIEVRHYHHAPDRRPAAVHRPCAGRPHARPARTRPGSRLHRRWRPVLGCLLADRKKQDAQPEAAVRYAIVIAIAVYAVVGVLLASQVTPSVRLRWTEGSPWSGVGLGLVSGGGVSLALLAVISSAHGGLSPDPRMVLMMSEGDLPHLLAAVLIFCLAAPLVEETLFRGLLLESLRPRGTGTALCASGLCFAIWHLMPTEIIYYTLIGTALGFLYLHKGLLCSMAAHVAFNSVLVVAAICVVFSPATTKTLDGLSLHVPAGWRTATQASISSSLATESLELRGPSGAQVIVASLPTPQAPSVAASEKRLTSPQLNDLAPGLVINPDSVVSVDSPVGVMVEADLTYAGHAGVLVIIPRDGTSYELTFASGGSEKARRDFTKMLDSLRLNHVQP